MTSEFSFLGQDERLRALQKKEDKIDKANDILDLTEVFVNSACTDRHPLLLKEDKFGEPVKKNPEERFSEALGLAVEIHPTVKRHLLTTFSLKSDQQLEKAISGERLPKPSDVRGMVSFMRTLAETVRDTIKECDSTLDALPSQCARFAGEPAFPDSLHRAAERPPHRPSPAARL